MGAVGRGLGGVCPASADARAVLDDVGIQGSDGVRGTDRFPDDDQLAVAAGITASVVQAVFEIYAALTPGTTRYNRLDSLILIHCLVMRVLALVTILLLAVCSGAGGEGDIGHTGLGVSLRTVQSELSHFDFSPPEMGRPDGQPFVIGRKFPEIAVYTAEIVELFLIGDAEDLTYAAVVFSTHIDPLDGLDVAHFIELLAPSVGGVDWVRAGLHAGWDWDGFDDITRDLDDMRIEAGPLPLDQQLGYLSTLHPDGSWRYSPKPVFLMVRFTRH